MIAVAIIFIILGIAIKHGKMYSLIAGYNTMPKAEQQKIDIAAIATVLRNALFGMAGIMIFGLLLAEWFKTPVVENIGFYGALILGIPYLLIGANSKKYRL
jgi:uncharacterized protein DUF3784